MFGLGDPQGAVYTLEYVERHHIEAAAHHCISV
eukprot:COSAG05_NODE_21397_length_272_cov_0.601156_2_plen_32_part_01